MKGQRAAGPIAALILALASPAASPQGMGDFSVSQPPFRLSRAAERPPAVSGDVDMAPLFQRLEDVGFDTRELRALNGRVEVFFRAPSGDAEAEYGYILDNLYLPSDFRADGGRIRYDLAGYEIATIIHEYVHAARDVAASAEAPRGSPAREHYDAVEAIWADLRSQALFYRYAWMKADEVSAYFMGAAISEVLDAVGDVVVYNAALGGSKAASVEEARRLGGCLTIPTAESAKGPWEKSLAERLVKPFGRARVFDIAVFKDNLISRPKPIHWRESQWVKDLMYAHILGLKPPRDAQELLSRLNSLDNEWIRGVRQRVALARLESAEKASRR